MDVDISVTDLGEGVEEAVFVDWLIAVGDTFDKGQAIAEVMTDKASVDIEAPFDGALMTTSCEADDPVKLGQVIGTAKRV